MRHHLIRPQLLRRLPDAGAPGRTHYRPRGTSPPLDDLALADEQRDRLDDIARASHTGSVLFVRDIDVMLIVPPFPLERALDRQALDPAPLIELLARRRSYAVMLLRLGGFSVGFFRGDSLIDSKTDQRFVKNRHRKGGQSQRRFERIRENQVRELFDAACATARAKLERYAPEIEHVFFGGDRRTLQAFRKRCDYFERFGARVAPRVLPLAGDPRRASLEAIPAEVWSSDVYAARRPSPRD